MGHCVEWASRKQDVDMAIETLQSEIESTRTIKLWSPNTIGTLTFFAGFPAGITLASINWFKMGMKWKAFVNTLIGIIGLVIIFLIPENLTRSVALLINLGFVAYIRYQMKADVNLLTDYKIENPNWTSGCLISLVVWVGIALIIFFATFFSPLSPVDGPYFYIDQGDKNFKKGDFNQAIIDYSRAIEVDPENELPYYDRGLAYANIGNYNLALADLDKAIDLNSNDANLFHVRGLIYKEMGNYEHAFLDQNRSIELDPKMADAYIERGIAYGNLGDHDNAFADFNKATELDPDNPLSFYNRGYEFYLQGNYQKAINDFNKTIKLNPNFIDAYNNRGISYAILGDNDKALADFNKTLELDPDYILAYRNRGLTYKTLGRIEESIQDFERFLETSTDPEIRKQVEEILKELREQ